MTGMADAHKARRGYERFVPPQAPPGMYVDPASGLFLPQGVRLASRGQVARAWFLGRDLGPGAARPGALADRPPAVSERNSAFTHRPEAEFRLDALSLHACRA